MIRKIWQEVSPRVYSHKAVTKAIAKKRGITCTKKRRPKGQDANGESLKVGCDSRDTLEGSVNAVAEGVEGSLSRIANFGVINDESELSRLLGRDTFKDDISSGGRRIDKESKGRIRLIDLDIGVGNTNVRLAG